MSVLKSYLEYKDSGIAWIGNIPKDWEKKKLSRLFAEIGSGGTPNSTNEMYHVGGSIKWINTGDLNDGYLNDTKNKITEHALNEVSTLKVYPENSLIVAMYGATIGKLAITNIKAVTNQACCVLAEPTNTRVKFMFYWFLTNREDIINSASGGGQPNISQSLIKSLGVFLPSSLKEQDCIVSFLDNKTTEIDSLISDKERLIELLEEKRQAVITETVTRGLDPNVKMKDSGIEWIGEIPEHWDTILLKRITKRIDVGIAEAATHAYKDKGVPIIRSTNIKEGIIKEDNLLYIDESFAEKNKRKYILKGDLLTVRTGNAGRTATVPESLNNSQCFTMLITTLSKWNVSSYYTYYLNAYPGETYFQNTAWGTAQKNISVPILQSCPVPKVPYVEQKAITEYLSKFIKKINELISDVFVQIKKLKEYRESLIYEAVTGKIDVRDYATETEEVY